MQIALSNFGGAAGLDYKAVLTYIDQLDASIQKLEAKAERIEAKINANLDAAVSSRASAAELARLEVKAEGLAIQGAAHDTDIKAAIKARADTIDLKIGNHNTNQTTRFKPIYKKLGVLVFPPLLPASHGPGVSLVAGQQVDLKVVELKEKKRILLYATEAGHPVDATLMRVMVSAGARGDKPITFEDVTAKTTVARPTKGVLDVRIDKDKKDEDVELLEFWVKREVSNDPELGDPIIHYGSTLFARKDRD